MSEPITRFAPTIACHIPAPTGTLLDLILRVTKDQIWPDLLYIVRHGESAGNVAREAALEAGEQRIDLHIRDVDVPLSDLGQGQAIALGNWFGALPPED